jgi:hypothetical protein
MKTILSGMTLIVVAGLFFCFLFVRNLSFVNECSGHLKRAADANTIELAAKELSQAVKYLEVNNMTSGYTSVFYRTPDEDIGFFYNNLKGSLVELNKVNEQTSQMEKSNLLMKLRETLTDHGKEGTVVTIPSGLYKYPHNIGFGIAITLSGLIGLIGCGMIKLASED